MDISPTIREQIIERASTAEMKTKAMEQGMLTLRMDGLDKFKKGQTSLEEVLRETAHD
jgi:type IV pilus assembly protein PilB